MDELQVQIQKILDEYDEEVQEAVTEAAKETAKETVKLLKDTSPVGRRTAKKYKNGWKAKDESSASGTVSIIVHNSTNPGLTHLLENGHVLRQGGRARAFPHIKPAEEEAQTKFDRKIKEKLNR